MSMNTLMKPITNIPMPSNISYPWNIGSLLGMLLTMQIITGILLSMHYLPESEMAFASIINITQETNSGWMTRFIHTNAASLFFLLIYLHISRTIYYKSYHLIKPWLTGWSLLILLMMTSFLGYTLPWGQMSFWAATVITNLLSTIPYIGKSLTYWLWGSHNISNPTLNRFFSLHLCIPFVMMFLTMTHLFTLHLTGSSNPLGTNSNLDKIPFNPYFTTKDLLTAMTILLLTILICTTDPYITLSHDNSIPANPLSTPSHIQPEWYFLFAYSILRSVPNKLGGTLALLLSIAILLTLPLHMPSQIPNTFNPKSKILFTMFIITFIMLSWLGSCPISPPFNIITPIFTTLYFLFFLTYPMPFLWMNTPDSS
uniref:Cytochrome b n=1 Tax=Armillifer agkistrodontis TaxID=592791 RepID=A0A1J0CYI8_ARMAG|nr:cytochrome b [Armillifer agkistrodontis]APB92076.1 cytochrome b [Armillifer agkistrodontis]